MQGVAAHVAHRRPAVAGWPWARTLGTAAGVLLGLVLLIAAWAKLIHPEGLAEQIRLEGLDFALPAPAVAYLALALEVALGLALATGIRRPWVLGPAAGLVAFFLFLTGRAWWLAAHGVASAEAGCGCFGNLLERTPAEAFWQDVLLLLPALLLAFVGRPRGDLPLPRKRLAAVAAATLGALVFAWRAPALPLDDLATRLKPGVSVAEICSGRGEARVCLDFLAPELARGEHLVVLADLADPGFGAAVPALNEHALAGREPGLVALTASPPEAQHAFDWSHGPAFPVREVPAALLAPLYRRLPRSFLVRDGAVVRTFPGLPPGPEPPKREPS
jgi:uncharacterized membrane protein YphA (DoxX/SURF4 family)